MAKTEEKLTYDLSLDLSGRRLSFPIDWLDAEKGRVEGLVPKAVYEKPYLFASISSSDGKTVWSGEVSFVDDDNVFELLLRETTKEGTQIKWSEIPSVLNILDGGYTHLTEKEANLLISDLIDFRNLVRCAIHKRSGDTSLVLSATFLEQENIKNLSEFIVDLGKKTFVEELKAAEGLVVEFELFEMSYFLVTYVEDSEDSLVVLRFTPHFYRHQKREGRRLRLETPIKAKDYAIDEISDFGLRLITKSKSSVGKIHKIEINGVNLKFICAYCHLSSKNEYTCGLFLDDFSENAQLAWQSFLLRFQYPDLEMRSEATLNDVWSQFEKTGYLKLQGGLGELVSEAKDRIFTEWKRTDLIGPAMGTCVLAKGERGRYVGTIAVNRVSSSIWVSQALAVEKSPKYIGQTRSLYAWRCRSIIQQPDARYNICFFADNKTFLDRFFRKFLLNLEGDDKQYVNWDENSHCYLIPKRSSLATLSLQATFEKKKTHFLGLLEEGQDSPSVIHKNKMLSVIQSPPHLQIGQHLSSLWGTGTQQLIESEATELFESGNTFISWFNPGDASGFNKKSDAFKAIGGQTLVLWTCERPLFPRFLGNCLRSFEIMHRKYGSETAA